MSSARRVVAILLGLAAALSVAAVSTAQGSDESDTSGLESMVECMARTQRLAAVVLVDESASLKRTDAQNLRVGMVEALVDALIDISRVPVDGIDSELHLAVVGFSSEVRGPTGQPATVSDWVGVTPDTDDDITSTILGFADRRSGAETDYVTALTTAQDLLIQRQADLGVGSNDICTAVLWFTDGKFDLVNNSQSRTWTADLDVSSTIGRTEALRRGDELLCRSGGVADQLRSASTYLLTFALLSENFSGDDEDLLRRVTFGDGRCGDIDGTPTGAYFPGRVPDGIADCFYLALQGQGCPPQPAEPGQCTDTGPCVRTFAVDDAIDLVRLEYTALPDLSATVLRSPSGDEIPLNENATLELAGVEVRVSAATRAGFATLKVSEGDQAAHGRWEVVNRPAEPGSLDLDIISTPSYRLRLDAPTDAVRGEPVAVRVTVTGRSGQPIDPSTVAGLSGVTLVVIDGELGSEVVIAEPSTDGSFTAEVTLPLENDALRAEVVARTEVLTGDGTPAELRSARAVLDVISPGYIRVSSALDLGVLEVDRAPDADDDHTQMPLPLKASIGTIEFEAPRDVGGTACVGQPSWALSRPTLTLTPQQQCVSLAAGESGAVEFTLGYESPEAGPLTGTLPITVTSDLDGGQQTVDVALDGLIRIPPPEPWSNAGVRLLLLVLGVLLPALAYFSSSIWLSRFEQPSLVQMTTHPLTLHPHGVEIGPAVLSSGNGSDFVFLDGSNSRTVSARGLTFRAPRRVAREPIAAVTSGLGHVLLTNKKPEPQSGRSEVGHELNGQWVFAPFKVDGQAVVGEVSVLTRETGEARAHADRILRDAENELARSREDLIGLLSGTSQAQTGGDESAGGVVETKYEW